jgi:hypothetical protein
MTLRELLTRRAIEQLPEQHQIPFEQAWHTWWMNPRKRSGFRLSRAGFTVMTEILELEHWRIDVPRLSLNNILELDQKLETPYYIDQKARDLVLFGSRDAVMANLHGDVVRWIQLMSRRDSQ